MKHFLRLIALALALTAISPLFAYASPTDETYIVSETFREIEDDTMDGLGWLTVYADVPTGYEGVVYVDLSGTFGKVYTISLNAYNLYAGGAWLPFGTYRIKEIYDPYGMLISTYAGENTVTISDDADPILRLTFCDDPDYTYPEWTGADVGITGTLPAPSEQTPTEAPTEALSEEPTEVSAADLTEYPGENPTEASENTAPAASVIPTILATLIFAAVVGIGVIIYRRTRENTVY